MLVFVGVCLRDRKRERERLDKIQREWLVKAQQQTEKEKKNF